MKVKELIKFLSECNPEAIVIVNDQEEIITNWGKEIPIEDNKTGKENCDIVSLTNINKIDKAKRKKLIKNINDSLKRID